MRTIPMSLSLFLKVVLLRFNLEAVLIENYEAVYKAHGRWLATPSTSPRLVPDVSYN